MIMRTRWLVRVESMCLFKRWLVKKNFHFVYNILFIYNTFICLKKFNYLISWLAYIQIEDFIIDK